MMGANYQTASLDDLFYSKYIGAQLKFAWLPKTCDVSGKRIWLQYGYRVTALHRGLTEPFFEHRWHDKLEHIIWRLKQ